MLVFRWETVHGDGPYASGESQCDELEPLAFYMDGLPCPEDDGISEEAMWGKRCGCVSFEDLGRWFPEEYHQALIACGFAIEVYDVPAFDVVRGNCHLAFDPRYASRLDGFLLGLKDDPTYAEGTYALRSLRRHKSLVTLPGEEYNTFKLPFTDWPIDGVHPKCLTISNVS